MVVRSLTEEQKRRDMELSKFKEIDRKLTERSKQKARVSRKSGRRSRSSYQRFIAGRQRVVKKEAVKLNKILSGITKRVVPSNDDLRIAAYKYAKKNPTSAKKIYNSMDSMARIVKQIVPQKHGKPAAEAMMAFSEGARSGIRNEPLKVIAFAAIPGAAGAAIKAGRALPAVGQIVRSERAMKVAARIFDVAYAHTIHTRVNAPVLDGYKDGKSTETRRTFPDGSIEITTKIEQIPVMRKPNIKEKSERLGYIFSTEAGPMVFGALGMEKVSKARFKELTHKGKRTARTTKEVIKEPAKIKKYAKIKKADIKKAKAIREARKKQKALEKKALEQKLKVLKVTKSGKLKLLEKTRKQLLKDEIKAKGKEKKQIQKRRKKVEADIKKAEEKALKEKVQVLTVTKTGKLKTVTKTRKQLLKEDIKAKKKETRDIKKRQKQADRARKKKKVVQLSDTAYAKIKRITALKAKLKALVAKIRSIPTSVAKKIGLNKTEEIRKANVLIRETDAVKTYVIMVQQGATKKMVVTHLKKLPENKLQVIDTKTDKIVKNLESMNKDIELRVIKPSKKPISKFKEVKTGKGMVQLQKVVTKQEIKTVTLAKTELKALQKLNAEAKAVQKTKAKTITAQKTKQRQLTKLNTKIKAKRKQMTVLLPRLRKIDAKLKQKQRSITILIPRQVGIEKAKTEELVKVIQNQRSKTKTVISEIVKTIEVSVPVEILVPKKLPRAKIKPKPVKAITAPKPKILLKPPDTNGKKKRRKVKRKITEAVVKNPIPSLEQFIR